jgi:uncharacterized protein (TIGR03437 family)
MAQTTFYIINTIAGDGTQGYEGDSGPATQGELYGPYAAVPAGGNLYISDTGNSVIRYVVPVANGNISTIAGNNTAGYAGDGGQATSAELNKPGGLAVDSSGNVYIADTYNHVIRKITTAGKISTIAGNGTSGYQGDNGLATGAELNTPSNVALDAAGANLYIADSGNFMIRKVTFSTGNIVAMAGTATVSGYYGDGGAATAATLNDPEGVALDAAGNLYIADTQNDVIRKVSNGIISTFAGIGNQECLSFGECFSGDGGPATKAQLNHPKGLAFDSAGNLYVADCDNMRIRMIAPSGIITTIAGDGAVGYAGDGGPATSAALYFPSAVSVDSSGNIYIADNNNNVIRMLTPAAAPSPAPSVTLIQSAGQFGAFASIAPGTWIEIYGANLAPGKLDWTNAFNGINAPTSLNGTTVTIGGQSAFLDYVSPSQVNAQVPSNVGIGPQQITVNTAAGASAPYNITVNATEPGLFAPPSLNVGGVQYVGATLPDEVTYILPPGVVSGITSRQAHPGETIYLYGVGFGPVTPNIPAGQIVEQNNSLNSTMQVMFGQTPATLSYSGLAPNFIGLYLFQVVVPNVPSSNAVPLTFTLNGVSGAQTFYTAVQD